MKRVRATIAAIAATALLAISGAEAALDRAVSIDETDPDRAPLSAADAPTTPLDVLVRVAEAGDVEAMNLLGVLYTLGVEVTRDYSKALYWYQKAIDGGSTNAMNNAAKFYLHGIGVPRDYANAAALFKRSAMGGSVQGMYSFAAMADKGMGISRDPRLAHEMYRGAAQAGYAPAMIRVSDDHVRGHGRGATWWRHTRGSRWHCEWGFPKSCRYRRCPESTISRHAFNRSAVRRPACAPPTLPPSCECAGARTLAQLRTSSRCRAVITPAFWPLVMPSEDSSWSAHSVAGMH